MQEADQYGPLWKGANSTGWHLFRIADGSVGKKPADIAGVAPDGRGVLIEVKTIRQTSNRLPQGGVARVDWKLYATHQRAWLARYAEAGALAIVAQYDEQLREMHLWPLTRAEHFYDGGPRVHQKMDRWDFGRGPEWCGWQDLLLKHAEMPTWEGGPLDKWDQEGGGPSPARPWLSRGPMG